MVGPHRFSLADRFPFPVKHEATRQSLHVLESSGQLLCSSSLTSMHWTYRVASLHSVQQPALVRVSGFYLGNC